jgi:hypothetical protein
MTFVGDVLASWLIGKIAEESSRRAIAWLRGPDHERALRQAADAAIRLTAAELSPDDHERAEQIEMVIGQVFSEQLSSAPLASSATLLEAIQAGIARQLAVLGDPGITGTRWSSAELLNVSVEALRNSLTSHLVREIVIRGAQGGPLASLATQINHDVTHLQGQRVEGVLAQLIQAVQEALARLESNESAMLLTVTHTLPADVATFTGRQADIDRILGALPVSKTQQG